MTNSKRVRILLVDDDGSTLRRACSIMRINSRVDVVATASGSTEALTLTRLHQPDLVLMSHAGGDRAVTELTEALRFTRVVVVSDRDDPQVRQMCQHSGNHSIIHSTRLASELCGIVQELYGSRR